MNASQVMKSESFLSKRRLSLAGVAAFVGCAACCTVPLLATVGLGGGFVATLASVFRPGSELLVGSVVFGTALGVMAVRSRAKREAGCGPSCRADGGCCDRGTAKGSA